MKGRKGLFIAIEGGDGLGKTTLLNNLKTMFPNAVFTHEPGGNAFCERIRGLIMEDNALRKETEMYLFCASRSEFVDKVVLPNLNAGKLVVTDRFVYSSYVYQGVLGKLGVENVEKANALAVRGVEPDVVICLRGRKSFRDNVENRFDKQTAEESQTIYDAFDAMAQKYSNFRCIDVTDKTPEEVFANALAIIKETLNKRSVSLKSVENIKE